MNYLMLTFVLQLQEMPLSNQLSACSCGVVMLYQQTYFGRKRKWLEEQIDRTCQEIYNSTSSNIQTDCLDFVSLATGTWHNKNN